MCVWECAMDLSVPDRDHNVRPIPQAKDVIFSKNNVHKLTQYLFLDQAPSETSVCRVAVSWGQIGNVRVFEWYEMFWRLSDISIYFFETSNSNDVRFIHDPVSDIDVRIFLWNGNFLPQVFVVVRL